MLEEDDLPGRKPAQVKDLSKLSVEELKEYVRALEAEIERVLEAIAAKESVRGAAEALFKKR